MENDDKNLSKPAKSGKAGRKLPGQFVSDELEAQTARFIEEVKGLAQRRKDAAAEEKRSLPPPPAACDQRSRRR